MRVRCGADPESTPRMRKSEASVPEILPHKRTVGRLRGRLSVYRQPVGSKSGGTTHDIVTVPLLVSFKSGTAHMPLTCRSCSAPAMLKRRRSARVRSAAIRPIRKSAISGQVRPMLAHAGRCSPHGGQHLSELGQISPEVDQNCPNAPNSGPN